jgi:hypothetical protein
MIGVPGFRPVLLISTLVVVAAALLSAWQYELRPTTTQQAVAATPPQRPEPRALSPEEETYAAALWEIQRQVTVSAVAMSYAGISYEIDNHDMHVLEQKIEPVAKFFVEAEPRVRGLTVPPSLSKVHGQYLEALVLYREASDEMLAFTKDGDRQHLVDAQGMGVTASEDILRAGEVLWPGQYKPH